MSFDPREKVASSVERKKRRFHLDFFANRRTHARAALDKEAPRRSFDPESEDLRFPRKITAPGNEFSSLSVPLYRKSPLRGLVTSSNFTVIVKLSINLRSLRCSSSVKMVEKLPPLNILQRAKESCWMLSEPKCGVCA